MILSDSEEIYNNCSRVVDLLSYGSLNRSDNSAFIFLEDGENQETELSYQELNLQTRAIAAQIQVLRLTGKRALLLYPAGLDKSAAFFDCLHVEVIAVSAHPLQNERNIPRIKAIAADAQAVIVLTTKTILSKCNLYLSKQRI